jgi:hypothetical protein
VAGNAEVLRSLSSRFRVTKDDVQDDNLRVPKDCQSEAWHVKARLKWSSGVWLLA